MYYIVTCQALYILLNTYVYDLYILLNTYVYDL
jgi:hypothetical protein